MYRNTASSRIYFNNARNDRDRRRVCGTFLALAIQQRTPDVTDNDCVRAPEKDTADYIATLAHELADMAAKSRLDVLRYLLEMARDEARSVVRAESDAPEGG